MPLRPWALAGNKDASFVAGGTTLIDLMKLDVERPAPGWWTSIVIGLDAYRKAS